jgi:Bacteriocin-protection, YdeI or OmpD-Associated
MLPVSADVRQNAGVAAGDAVEVDLEPDTAPRQVAVPPDFAATLDQDGNAERVFDGLSCSKKQWHVLSIEGARTGRHPAAAYPKSLDMLRDNSTA